MTFETVYLTLNQVEATMVRDFLLDQGIACKLSSQFPGAVYGSSVEEIQVQVDAEVAPHALELVEAYFSAVEIDLDAEFELDLLSS